MPTPPTAPTPPSAPSDTRVWLVVHPPAYAGTLLRLPAPAVGDPVEIPYDLHLVDRSPADAKQARVPVSQVPVRAAFLPRCCYAHPTAPLAEQLYAAYHLGGLARVRGQQSDGSPALPWEWLTYRAQTGDAAAGDERLKWMSVAARARGTDIDKLEQK